MPAGLCGRAGEPRGHRARARRRVRAGADGPRAGQRPGVRQQAARRRHDDPLGLRPPRLLHGPHVLGRHAVLPQLQGTHTGENLARTGQNQIACDAEKWKKEARGPW